MQSFWTAQPENPFFAIDRLPSDFLRPGTERRSIRLGEVLFMFITYDRPTVSPTHEHPHHSILYIDRGEFEVRIGEQVRQMQPGEGAVIAAGVPHGLTTSSPEARIIEVWYPVPEQDQT